MSNFFTSKLNNVSIAKKLYFTMGIMAFLIALELFSLSFSISTLSAVRAYVNGEGLYSKAQKDAIYALRNYIDTHEEKYYTQFKESLKVNLGDQKARIALDRPNPDKETARQGLIEGRNHPEDIDGVINVFIRFRKIYYIDRAITLWASADSGINSLINIADDLHQQVLSNGNPAEIKLLANQIDTINDKITLLEDEFSYVLGEGSRWLEDLILKLLLAIALTVEVSGLILTISVSRGITKGVDEIIRASKDIARGDFSTRASVYSKDEIGVLAGSFNHMTEELEQSIIKRQESEHALKESDERYKELFENTTDLIQVVGTDGSLIYANRAWCESLGYDETEVKGLSLFQIMSPDYQEHCMNVFQSTIQDKQSQSIETKFIKKNGESIVLEGNISCNFINGQANSIQCFLHDITSRKIQEENLKRETTYVKLLQTVAVAANDAQTFKEAVKICMDKVCEVTGWPIAHLYLTYRENARKLRSTNIWHIDDEEKYKVFKELTEHTDLDVIDGLPDGIFEKGKSIWIDDVTKDRNFIRGNNPEIGIKSGFAFPILVGTEVVGIVEFFSPDIVEKDERLLELVYHLGTQLGRVFERTRSAEELKISEEQTRSIINTAHDAIILLNDKGVILDWNPQAENIFGWKKEEIIGLTLLETIVPPQYYDAFLAGMNQYEKNHDNLNGLNIDSEDFAKHRDGHEFPVEYTISRIEVKNGNLFVIFIRDISERKEYELNLKKAKERAEASEKIKQLFLANMSHEIRTPMNAVIGFARILEETKLSPEQEEAVDAIKQSGENLMVIINDILDFSKMEAGKVELEQTRIDLRNMISSTVDLMKPRYAAKNVQISYHFDDRIPKVIIGDAIRVNQIFINLISNAVKFTINGTINITADLITENDNQVDIKFVIKDTGIGMPKEKLETIFESFTQASSDTTRKFGGTGLGLAIVKQLIDLHEGTINVESAINKGSTFTFTLRFLKETAIKPGVLKEIDHKENHVQQTIENHGDINILVVEDNPINQLLATKVISNWGFNVDLAENGKVAIHRLREKNYSLILMDIQMPIMDGYEATNYIRVKMGNKKNIPIVAMTAHAIKGEMEKCIKLGMNDYVSKPFDPQDLYDKIIKYSRTDVEKDL